MKYDFSGYATRANLKCSDGRTILRDAFKHHDGQTVPLVWMHQHNDPFNVLGHAVLENREDGVYAYCTFNDTESGKNGKLLVEHGDVTAMSIYANELKQQRGTVSHGTLREVSLVIAGRNPGAFIDSVLKHGEESDDAGIIYTGEDFTLYHAEDDKKEGPPSKKTDSEDKASDEETVGDVFGTLSDKQKAMVFAMFGQALEKTSEPEDNNNDSEGGNKIMKHNAFENKDFDQQKDVLSHADTEAIFSDVKRYGSLRDSVLAHGIEQIDYLFPDAKNVTNVPQFIKRDMGWVQKVMGATHHTPFSRIKSLFADITEDDARAKGYIKGALKKEEFFSLLKRTTTPTTVYKKQKSGSGTQTLKPP